MFGGPTASLLYSLEIERIQKGFEEFIHQTELLQANLEIILGFVFYRSFERYGGLSQILY